MPGGILLQATASFTHEPTCLVATATATATVDFAKVTKNGKSPLSMKMR